MQAATAPVHGFRRRGRQPATVGGGQPPAAVAWRRGDDRAPSGVRGDRVPARPGRGRFRWFPRHPRCRGLGPNHPGRSGRRTRPAARVRRGPREGNRRRLRSSGVDAGDQRPRRPGPLRRSAAGRGRGVGPRPGRPVAGVGIRTAHRDRRHRPGRTGCNRAPVGHRFPAGQRAGGGGGDHRCSLGAGPGAAAGRSDRGRAGRASRRSTRRGRACVVAGLGRAPRSGPWPNSGE